MVRDKCFKIMSVIYIIWLRQLRRYVRSRARLVGSLGQPILFLVALGFGFGPVFERAGEGDYIQFLAPGVVTMSILFTAIFTGIEVIWDKQFGFLKETLVAPVSRFKIMLGRTLGGATVATIQGVIVFSLTLLFGFRPDNWLALPLVLLAMFLIALFFTALGTAIASMLEDMQGFQLIMNFLVMPIFFLSGALFPLDELPGPIWFLTRIDPLAYGVDAIRQLLIGFGSFNLYFDFGLLAGLSLLMLFIGSALFNRIQI